MTQPGASAHPHISPIQQHALGEKVSHALRYLIITGELQADEHLVESSLSRLFDVSRGPIRDALRTLEHEGLVRSGRKGVYVVGLHDADIKELYSLRSAIETLAMGECMARAAEIDWAPMDGALSSLGVAAESRDVNAYAAADLDFHTKFFEQSGHRRVLTIWQQFLPTFSVLLEVTNAQDRDLHPSLLSHAKILELARHGDRDGALRELRVHLEGSSDRLRKAHPAVKAKSIPLNVRLAQT